MALQNYVELVAGTPTTFHFTAHALPDRVVRDPETGLEKHVRALVLTVDRVNGEEMHSTFSTLSAKLVARLQPWLDGQRYLVVQLRITKMGSGYLSEYMVEPLPL